RSRLGKLATAIGSDLVLAGVRRRSATFTPQKLPKVFKGSTALGLNDWNRWRSLGDSNPCFRREREITPSDIVRHCPDKSLMLVKILSLHVHPHPPMFMPYVCRTFYRQGGGVKMARTLQDAKLDTRAARQRLKRRREPHWRSIS